MNVGRFCIGIILEGSRLGVGWVWVVGVGGGVGVREGIRCSKSGSVSARRLASSILSESGWSISMFAILCAN